MSDDEILAKLTEIIRDQLDEDDIVLNMSTLASSVEGWDSLAHVRVMIGVEEAFGIRFQTSEITSLKNVGELVALVRTKL
ncbi:acyl carrier protein [Sphingomonas asaccharolytica]|jgi:acyl carrier protein|uniref:acyl carrier protein n=1 Tax=Sphingomonas asaccharolytica TaxID=40681 RepID=UPI00082A3254|nr:acyl carrier protein [Sphingomonas asaccharolytica]